MKKISCWAAANRWKSRIIMIIAHILILSLGWYTGVSLNKTNVSLPGILLFVFVGCYLLSIIYYPSKKEKRTLGIRRFYSKQKFFDFSIAFAAWAMIVCIGNNKNIQTGIFNYVSASSTVAVSVVTEKPTAAQILESLKYRDKSTLTKQEKRILKNEFKHQLKRYVAATVRGDKAASGEAGTIVLACIAAAGLLYLVAALSCNLSCNGNDGAAIIVALLGTGGIVLGLVLIIKGVQRKRQREEEAQQKQGVQ